MSYYLFDHKNPNNNHFYTSRRGSILAIVVHITAGLEDLDGQDDQSAEKTAQYAATTERQVSWHSGSDADSSLDLLPASYTAFHCRGYNSRTYGHEISKKTTDWRTAPEAWVDATLSQAANKLAAVANAHGIPFRRATKAELDLAIARNLSPVGFIGHAALDPSRRTDPGLVNGTDTFPWERFFELCRAGGATPPSHPAPIYDVEDAAMKSTVLEVGPLGADGKGWTLWDPGLGRDPIAPDANVRGNYPPDDGYSKMGAEAKCQARGGKVCVEVQGGPPGGKVPVFVRAW